MPDQTDPKAPGKYQGSLKLHGLADIPVQIVGEWQYIEHVIGKLRTFWGPLLKTLEGTFTPTGK